MLPSWFNVASPFQFSAVERVFSTWCSRLFSLFRPDDAAVRVFLREQAQLEFNYPDVGASRGQFPLRYDHDHFEVVLGRGRDVFDAARIAIENWQHFNVGWAEAIPLSTPITAADNVAIRARLGGIWGLAAGRVIEVIDDLSPDGERFGFSFGTLPGHPEQGEERFEICLMPDGRVRYRVAAFFRSNHWAIGIAWPYLRQRFNRFRRETAKVLEGIVQDAATES
ncbi:DUF1990 domain-containing protein [Roseiconus nitratireducens]|uniref:DUF1990 domain-containing protein n=1 Tax=Roseiconus nitratireducens TaxID=2605748 RepID=A0A5M6CVC5_9BACT|nr:DUF1990 domain-containing protein [Roseiconus nitratireducens]KAA5539184.1 DUF1990 domain-containing protein [Roseiconus nitratireducens]